MLPATESDTDLISTNSIQNELKFDKDIQQVKPEEASLESRININRGCKLSESGCANCRGCMAEFFSRSYEYLSDLWASVVDWSYDYLCCAAKDDDETQAKVMARKKATPKLRPIAQIDSPKLASISRDPIHKENTTVRELSPTKSLDNVIKPTSSPTQNTSLSLNLSPPTPQPPPQPQAQNPIPINLTSSPASTTRSPLHLPTFKTGQEIQESFCSPPKIQFETTGSIFGDRKRSTIDHNMLQIENGRYRSPGTSKTIHGPNGRVIRVSFVSGFPSYKSSESRSTTGSIGSRISLRKSTDTPSLNDKGVDPFSKKWKSVKSTKSLTSNDGQKEEESLQS